IKEETKERREALAGSLALPGSAASAPASEGFVVPLNLSDPAGAMQTTSQAPWRGSAWSLGVKFSWLQGGPGQGADSCSSQAACALFRHLGKEMAGLGGPGSGCPWALQALLASSPPGSLSPRSPPSSRGSLLSLFKGPLFLEETFGSASIGSLV
ncbi:hypothetical protein E2I00_004310, partial [Balaenoptera physalus]